jgi:hypothetical protein
MAMTFIHAPLGPMFTVTFSHTLVVGIVTRNNLGSAGWLSQPTQSREKPSASFSG